MNDNLTNRQIFFILYVIVVGYGIINLPKNIVQVSGTEGWIPILFVTLIAMVITYIITYLGYTYENKTLFEYSKILVGNTITCIFSVIFTLYFLIVSSMLLRLYAETVVLVILNKTPVWAICIVVYATMYYAVTKGLTVIGMLCELYGFFSVTGFIIINFIMSTQGKLINIRPIYGYSDINTYLKASLELILPFLGMEILTFIPISKKSNKGISKFTTLALGFIGLFYIYVTECSLAVLGADDIIHYKATLFYIVRGIDIPILEIFRRLDGLYIIFWTMNVVCSNCIWSYGTIFYASKLFNNLSYKAITITIFILSFILSQLPRNMDQVEKAVKYTTYFGIIPSVIIPIILLIITKVKKYDKKA